ncbi:MAG TPA: hypothetical protein VF303_00040 [Candidatus Nanoarchaeia archaeon]
MSHVFREVLVREFRRRRGEISQSLADTGLIAVLLQYPKQDERFLRKLAKQHDGVAMLQGLFEMCPNGDLRELIRVSRRWAMKDTSQGAFLDLIDCADRVLRSRARAARESSDNDHAH